MWACHNDREEDQRGSPRESRVTVAPPFRVVKATGCSVNAALDGHRIAHPFDDEKLARWWR